MTRIPAMYRRLIRIAAPTSAFLVLVLTPLFLSHLPPPGLLGATFCFPIVGPVQRFATGMPESTLAGVRAHEEVHAEQCRRDGALWQYTRRVVPGQRLQAEAEAYCGEARYGDSHGGEARLTVARALDELREGSWFRRFSDPELAAALEKACPDVVLVADRQQLEWRRRLHHGQRPR